MLFCLRHGFGLSDEDFHKKVFGLKNEQIFQNLWGNELSKSQIVAYSDEKEAIYRELFQPIIKEISGFSALLKSSHHVINDFTSVILALGSNPEEVRFKI